MDSSILREICMQVASIEGDLMYGYIDFTYDRLLTVMGAGHPGEILDRVLAPVFWPVTSGQDVELKDVEKFYKDLKNFKNSFQVQELTPVLKELKTFLEDNGVATTPAKIKLDALKKSYVGKTLSMEKLRKAGDVWNLVVSNGILNGHFYWNDDKHSYCDDFYIGVDDEMRITDIRPLSTGVSDGQGYVDCRYTLVHNGEFDKLLKAATAAD